MADHSSDEAQIRAVIENWAKAVRDVNMEGILGQHSDDILMFDVPPPLQNRGPEAYKETWDLFFQYSQGGPGTFDLKELNITAGDTVAFATSLLEVAGSTARLTLGLRKVNGDWLIAHEHHSYPAE
jgi:ketosteroid isomerase-like protein